MPAMTDRTAAVSAVSVGTCTKHDWQYYPLYRSQQKNDGTYHVRATQASSHLKSIPHACCTQVQAFTRKANIQSLGLVDGGKNVRLPSNHAPVQEEHEIPRQDEVVPAKTAVSAGINGDASRLPSNAGN